MSGVTAYLFSTRNGVDRGIQFTFNGEGGYDIFENNISEPRCSIGLTFYTAILLIGSQNRWPFVSVLVRNIQ